MELVVSAKIILKLNTSLFLVKRDFEFNLLWNREVEVLKDGSDVVIGAGVSE